MRTSIFYQPEAYNTQSRRLMGRNAAGESFLKGFLKYSKSDKFWAQVQTDAAKKSFLKLVEDSNRSEPVEIYTENSLGKTAEPGNLFCPGPGISDLAWKREFFGRMNWSLCGITHTTASQSVMDSVAEYLTAPIQPWDCLICTSHAVRENIHQILHHQSEYLIQRLGVRQIILPQTPVIPLGVHVNELHFSRDQHNEARQRIGVNPDEIVVLYLGRLSFHAKAHPLTMYQALEETVAETGKKIVLVECGWYDNDFIKQAFNEAAEDAAPSVKRHFLDGRISQNRKTAWACADIFCSFADNVQETFGITPIEAMAAGLPMIISDWNGYRDSVQDGVQGFLIPTAMPAGGFGQTLALRYAFGLDSYDRYCGNTSSLISVNLAEAKKAFVKLCKSRNLRKKMGAAGKRKAKIDYDWSVIIGKYEELWSELTEIRNRASSNTQTLRPIWPARLDPFVSFKSYPTKILSTDTEIFLSDNDVKKARDKLERLLKLEMVKYATAVLPPREDIEAVLEGCELRGVKVSELINDVHPESRQRLLRSIAWLLKFSIVCMKV